MLSLAEGLTVTIRNLSKFLEGLDSERAKLMNFRTDLGAVGVAGGTLCPPIAFAVRMFSLNFESVAMYLSRNDHSVMLCWEV